MKKEKKKMTLAQKANIIRAAVMGANDGILSISGIVLGVAGATSNTFTIFIAGFAGTLAGTVSMAMGEYVSVHSQNDAQRKAEQEAKELLETDYQSEFDFVKQKYLDQGISEHLAQKATEEMMQKDPLLTTVRERHGFTLNNETDAMAAAITSMISFPIGSILPMMAITLLPSNIRIIATFISVIIALAITGMAAAKLAGSNMYKAAIRNVISGAFTMIVTHYIGILFGR